jgi:ABC-2 type transport system permease protein
MQNEINKMLIVSYYTFREIIKSRILINVTLIGVALLIVTYVASQFTYGVPGRVALDFGLGALSLSSVAIAIFMGVTLLSKEIDSRTIYMVISRPIKRSSFLLGKIFGLSLVLMVNILILSILTISVYLFLNGNLDSLIFWTIFLIFIESLITLLIVVLFSLLTNNTLSVVFTIVLFLVGHSIKEAQLTSFVLNHPIIGGIIDIYHFVLPGYYKLNLKDFLLYEQNISLNYLVSISGYGILYSFLLVLISVTILNQKNLD